MGDEHELVNLTQPEVVAILDRNPMVVIPVGSVEQHGPHLPCGTDTFAAEVVAKKVAADLNALLVPFTPLGVTPFHMSFVGTVSLTPETFMGLLTEVCESMAHHGAKRFVVINWHEGNNASIDLAA